MHAGVCVTIVHRLNITKVIKSDSENVKLTLSKEKNSKKIPLDMVIHQTGISEPLELNDFSLISSYFHEKGNSQLLGTTFTEHKDNINFVFNNFDIFPCWDFTSPSG